MKEIVSVIEQSYRGIKKSEILRKVNMTKGRVDNCLKHLQVDGIIQYEDSVYFRTLNPWIPDIERSEKLLRTDIMNLNR